MRVLDIGCGRAVSSIFLRREFGVQVWATDLWFTASENQQRIRDAGMEVIYSGLRQTPEQIVAAAVQEDVDVVAMSLLSGAHNHLFPKVVELLGEKGAGDILVVGGGVIPDADIPFLKEKGVAEIFTPGTPTSVAIEFIKNNVKN
jgi:methylmalonyl-CoA mutase C-terminal domain/subunit